MTTLPLALIFLAILIIGHELGHFLAAKLFKLKVEEFSFGFPPRIFKRKIGDTLYTIGAVPFGGFVKIYGENPQEATENQAGNFQNLPAFKKAVVVGAGALANLLMGWLAISVVLMIGTPPSLFISKVISHTPAYSAGLKEGDRLKDFANISEFISFINANRGQEISLEVVRGTENLTVKIVPRLNPPPGEGPLGVALLEGGLKRHSFFSAFYEGGKLSLKIFGLIFVNIFNLLTHLLKGDWEVARSVTGPVGIFNFLGSAGSLGIAYLLQILAFVSLNLAAINLIPFPALDGGRLFFILYQKLAGGNLSYKFETIAHTVGFVLLLLLMLAITVKDVINLK